MRFAALLDPDQANLTFGPKAHMIFFMRVVVTVR